MLFQVSLFKPSTQMCICLEVSVSPVLLETFADVEERALKRDPKHSLAIWWHCHFINEEL